MGKELNKNLIAPCGINCGLCSAYLREKNSCVGCNLSSLNKPKYCVTCIIKNCEFITSSSVKFCYVCPNFPCKKLKQLNKRYSTKYNVFIFENLKAIQKELGLENLKENKIWKCASCNNIICMHKGYCQVCEEHKKENVIK